MATEEQIDDEDDVMGSGSNSDDVQMLGSDDEDDYDNEMAPAAAVPAPAAPAASTPCCICFDTEMAAPDRFEAPCGCVYCRECLTNLCANMGGELPKCACGNGTSRTLEMTAAMVKALPKATYSLWQRLHREAHAAATHTLCPWCCNIVMLPLFTKTFLCSNPSCISPKYGYCVKCSHGVQQLPHQCG